MGECAALCQLRPEIVNLPIDDALALIRGCHEADAAAHQKCSAEKRRLVKWINGQP